MEKRFATTMLVSALLATAVAAAFYSLAKGVAIGGGPHLTAVVCAVATLPVGSKIRRDDLRLTSVPESLKSANGFSRIEDVVGRPVIATILKDEPVLAQRLADTASGAGLAPMIPAGYRAMSVRVNDVIGVAGYAQPGMKVDVLVTGHRPESQDTLTRTVLQNVLVLSAGQVLQAEPKGQAITAALVTLQVTPQQAEVLTLVSDGGHIQLVLRNSTDSAIQTSQGTQLSTLYGEGPRIAVPAERTARSYAPPPEPLKITERTARVEPPTVEIIRGSHRSDEMLKTAQGAQSGSGLGINP